MKALENEKAMNKKITDNLSRRPCEQFSSKIDASQEDNKKCQKSRNHIVFEQKTDAHLTINRECLQNGLKSK